jgi:hypothetical protein
MTSARWPALALLALVGTLVWPHVAPAQSAPSHRLLCRSFAAELGSDVATDTADTSHPLGQWVTSMVDRGWQIHTMELAIGQKQTGYAQGFHHVCLRPR